MNSNEFLNVKLKRLYRNGKQHHLPTANKNATCVSMIEYDEMSPQKRFVHCATPVRCETTT